MPNSAVRLREPLTAWVAPNPEPCRRACVVGALVLAFVAFPCALGARAESIWDRRERSSAFLYSDNAAAEIGDSLTVLIVDLSTVKSKGDRKLEKTTASSGSVNIDTSLVNFRIPAGGLNQESSRTFEGSNDFKSTRELRDSITVTVIDKLPNGNLVIAGRTERDLDGDKVVTVLTGIVKPEDISGANTVSSTRVAHLNIHYEASGIGVVYEKRGWLNWALDIIWPF